MIALASLREARPDEPETYKLTVFHTTLLDNWDSILAKGLVPGHEKPAGQDWIGKWSGKGTYCHLTLPLHEIDSNVDELQTLTIEAVITVPAENVVSDEEFGSPEDTLDIIAEKGPVVIGQVIRPNFFYRIHFPNTDEARSWAEENIKLPCVFHD
jgi:hypothetical protein